MDVGEFRPGHRDHLGGGVQLHRAGPERDHAAVECQVAVGEAAHIAQHLGLGAIAMEHRLAHEAIGPPQHIRNRCCRRCTASPTGAKRAKKMAQNLGRACLVETGGDGTIHRPQIDPGLPRRGDQIIAIIRRLDDNGIKELIMPDRPAGGPHGGGKTAGHGMGVAGDPGQPFRPVP